MTGTLWSGTIAEGDTLRVAPRGGEVRVRTVQVHDTAVPSATAGERVALGLPGIERRELHRGDALVTPGAFPVSYRLDVELEELVRDRERRARLRASRHVADPGTGRARR